MVTWYWIDTGWACGGVKVKNGRVIFGAPIFRKFKGQRIEKLGRHYHIEKVWPKETEAQDG